jgi:hypothetical protein
MEAVAHQPERQGESEHARYEVDIEGRFFPWTEPRITPEQIRQLGGFTGPVTEVDEENNQRVLPEGEEVELKPGQGFAKKHRYQRG